MINLELLVNLLMKRILLCIFRGVGFDFNPCVASTNMNSTINAIDLTIEEVFGNLLSYEHMLEEHTKSTNLHVMQANIAKMQLNKSNGSCPQSNFGGSTGDVHNFLHNTLNFARSCGRNNTNDHDRKRNIQCQICGKQGHVAHTCFQL